MRVLTLYGWSLNAPLCIEIAPEPFGTPPCQTAVLLRLSAMCSSGRGYLAAGPEHLAAGIRQALRDADRVAFAVAMVRLADDVLAARDPIIDALVLADPFAD